MEKFLSLQKSVNTFNSIKNKYEIEEFTIGFFEANDLIVRGFERRYIF